MEQYEAVVIVASVGGIQALSTVLSALPADFPVPVFVVQHRSSTLPSVLSAVIGRSTNLEVKNAEQGETPRAGTVYLAPADRHMTITPEHTIDLLGGKRIKFLLSAGDPLFVSAAKIYGNGVIAVVLTGMIANGAVGVRHVKRAGGVVIAQDQRTSQAFQMPQAAIATGCVDAVLPLEEIGPQILALTRLGVRVSI
jgi:two-component system chemotaxis response regulator CheB